MYPPRTSANGFSLVELSIVLVILGLLVGGILTGRSLIRAAELRSVTTEYERYHTATRAFRDKYFMLPGDMTNATQFWGLLHADAATCADTASTDARTCNGDGNGLLDNSAASYEHARAWQHLANAGLIEGSYAGNHDGCGSGLCPNPKIDRTIFWYLQFYDPAWGNCFNVEHGNSLQLTSGWDGPLRPEEAWNIDMKMDDGKPATGKVLVYASLASCTDTAVATNLAANYLLTSSAKVCGLTFRQQF